MKKQKSELKVVFRRVMEATIIGSPDGEKNFARWC